MIVHATGRRPNIRFQSAHPGLDENKNARRCAYPFGEKNDFIKLHVLPVFFPQKNVGGLMDITAAELKAARNAFAHLLNTYGWVVSCSKVNSFFGQ